MLRVRRPKEPFCRRTAKPALRTGLSQRRLYALTDRAPFSPPRPAAGIPTDCRSNPPRLVPKRGSGGKSGRFLSPAVQDPPRIEVHHRRLKPRAGPTRIESLGSLRAKRPLLPLRSVFIGRFRSRLPCIPAFSDTADLRIPFPPHLHAEKSPPPETPLRQSIRKEFRGKLPAIRESGIQTACRPRIPRIIRGFCIWVRIRSSDIRPNYRSRPHRPFRNRSGFSPNASTRLVRTALPSRYGKGENSARAPPAIGSNASAGAASSRL